jgi:hypothetical protein
MSSFGVVSVLVGCFLPSATKATLSMTHIPTLASHVGEYARL